MGNNEKSEFQKNLEENVEFNERLIGLENAEEVYKKAIQKAENEPVKDPEKIKKLKQELTRIRKLIREEKSKKETKNKKEATNDFDIKEANYDELLARREEIKLSLEELLASPVVDPEKKKLLEKELIEIETALVAMEGIEIDEEQQDKKKEEADKNKQDNEEKKEEQKDENELNETEKQEQEAKKAALEQAYYNAMLEFYALREVNQKNTINSARLVSTEEEYLKEIKAEDAMYKARDAYLKVSNKDPFEAEREELREQEKRLNKEIMDNLNKKAEEYRKLEEEIDKLNKARQEKLEEIDKATKEGATQNRMKELNDELDEIDIKLKNRKQDMAIVKENLSKSIEILANRKARRQELSLESREYRAQSYEEQQNIKYHSSKDSKGVNDYKQAQKQETQNIKRIVEEHETRFKELQKELKKVNEKEPDNFAKKLELLKQLDDTSQQLKASKEIEKDIEKGIEPDTDEAIKKLEKDYKSKEEKKSEFKKQAEDLIKAAKEQEKKEGEQTVEDPTKDSEKLKEEKKEEAVLAAVGVLAIDEAMGGEIKEETKDAIIVSAAVNATENIPPSPIDGLGQEQVKQIDDTPEGRKNAEETIEMAKEAQKDANEIQQRIEKEVQE